MDACDTIAEAIAIKSGRIPFDSSNSYVKKFTCYTTSVIDLHGFTAAPSLIDRHPCSTRGGVILSLQLNNTDSGRNTL